jgi:GNAT superfamily N-acetyltransferase
MTIQIREAVAADAAAISALFEELGYAVESSDVPARLDAVRHEGGAAWVADGGGEILGVIVVAAHAVLHAAGPVALITALVVSSAARGRGVGRRLVEAAKDWARACGCIRLIVTSGEQRADAHAFYPACGLPYTGRRFAVNLT